MPYYPLCWLKINGVVCFVGEGIDKNNSPLRIQTIVRRTKFTVPESVLENGKLRKVEPEEISPAREPAARQKKSKSRVSIMHTAGQKHRPRKLSHQGNLNGYSTSIRSDFPPTPVDSTTFIMPSPKDVFFPAQNGFAAPVLTPPVSPAVSIGINRNGHAHVSYSGISNKEDTKVRQSCLYSTGGETNPSSDDIDRLVEQHFNSCGLGEFVHSNSRRENSYQNRQVHCVISNARFVLFCFYRRRNTSSLLN